MGYKHDAMVKKATRAIWAVRGDHSVSHKQALESLEQLKNELNILIRIVEDAIEYQESRR